MESLLELEKRKVSHFSSAVYVNLLSGKIRLLLTFILSKVRRTWSISKEMAYFSVSYNIWRFCKKYVCILAISWEKKSINDKGVQNVRLTSNIMVWICIHYVIIQQTDENVTNEDWSFFCILDMNKFIRKIYSKYFRQ